MATEGTVQVVIPTPLRRYTNGEAKVTASAETIGGLLTKLDQQYPGLGERLTEPDGQIRRFVNVFVNGENVRERDGVDTPLKAGDEVGIIPAMAGGR